MTDEIATTEVETEEEIAQHYSHLVIGNQA